ncbi:adenine phosphoribosyltransferase 1 isoform X1 [Lactuca sativa]|uniref:adenine phosphoribosyltransferase n=1 Tax=Lactuca sativa TaxID=4236 RepID=A0A9R1WMJ4_LACSA|nr:adenine phosphoribosyltransferase 1 isoform X1 [Lactuca sativa]KAJ0226454.1 hypothetical protein LSAT_V11C100010050 [Lactuca sativa]
MNTLKISFTVLKKPTTYFFSGNSVISLKSLTPPSSVKPASISGGPRVYSTFAGAGVRTDFKVNSYSNMAEPDSDHKQGDVAVKDDRIARISSTIRVIPDFPKPGIMFQDITTMLLDPVAFKDSIDLFVERYKDKDISVVAGVEARGFIFGPPIALAIGAKFVPMRKPNKLPGISFLPLTSVTFFQFNNSSHRIICYVMSCHVISGAVISEEYSLEYGSDIMEMHVGAVEAGERTLVIDDLIATGGTLVAAINLLERVGANVVECACVIELPDLKGRDRLGDKPLFVLISST